MVPQQSSGSEARPSIGLMWNGAPSWQKVLVLFAVLLLVAGGSFYVGTLAQSRNAASRSGGGGSVKEGYNAGFARGVRDGSDKASSTASAPADASISATDSAAFSANALAGVLSDALLGDLSYEPKGGVKPSQSDEPVRFAALVSAVSADPPSVTCDLVQQYYGATAATEAKKDGSNEVSAFMYTRNRYKSNQKLSVSPDAVVILWSNKAEGEPYFIHPSGGQGLMAVPFAEFAQRFNASPERYRDSSAYVITYRGDSVSSLVQTFLP